MNPAPKFTLLTLLIMLLIAGCAAGARSWYLMNCAGEGWYDGPLQVQGDPPRPMMPASTTFRGRERPTEIDNLAANVAEKNWFGGWAPLAEQEELTAHRAPGYPWLLGSMAIVEPERADWAMRWLQCGLGSLTAVFLFLFARRAFQSNLVAILAGLLAAIHPFWIINTAELNDGVLTCFLFAACLMLGARGSQTGGAFSGLLFGASLAGLCMVRAVMLPFAIMSLLWFLLRCRRFTMGWFAGIVSVVGFLNGLAPWGVRNYHAFGRPVPVSTTSYYHLWMGNNPNATGSVLDEQSLRVLLTEERLKELLDETNQANRYDMVANEFWKEVTEHPTATLSLRVRAALAFFFGDSWLKQQQFAAVRSEADDVAGAPPWVMIRAENILHGTILGLFILALLGWRWSCAWHVHGRLATIAALWIPLPYILSHAEALSGPRLPYDGILLCYAAYALVSFLPGVVGEPVGEDFAEELPNSGPPRITERKR